MKCAVITACYGDYDTIKPVFPQEGVEVEWILVTDHKLKVYEDRGWKIYEEPYPGVHPNRAAKLPKMFPWNYTDCEASVWVDASYRVISPHFVRDVLTYASPIAQFVHPWRDCVFAEAIESSKLIKYNGEPCMEQVASYGRIGMPRNWGLWATGVIARHHTAKVYMHSDMWHNQIMKWTFQDQLSHPYASWKCGLRPNSLPGTHLSNDWLRYEGSGRH